MMMLRSRLTKMLLGVIAVDQVSKWLATRLGLVTINSGVSLGLFSVLPALALTIMLIAVLIAVWRFYAVQWQTSPLAAGFFFGGGISNIVDRWILGGVRDWLPLPYLRIHNNLADYAIALGLVILVLVSLKNILVEERRHPVTAVTKNTDDNLAVSEDEAET